MVTNKCSVIGCKNSVKRKYVFPKNEDDLKIWVVRTGNPVLKNLSVEAIKKTYKICKNHFDKCCDSPGTNQKLKQRSLPTLNLPALPVLYESPLNWSNREPPIASSNCIPNLTSIGGSSLNWSSISPPNHNYSSIIQQYIEQEAGKCVSHSTPLHTPSSSKRQWTSSTTCASNQFDSDLDGIVPLVTETNQNMLLNTVKVNRKGKLTPNCKKLYKEAMKLKRRAERLEKQNKSTRCQLNLANRFTHSTFTTQIMKKVNSSTFK